MQIADLVISKKGKYDGEMFFVIAKDDNSVLLCDGKKRKTANPKRKNVIHLEETGENSYLVAKGIEQGGNTLDALMRKELKRLKLMLQSKVSD